MRLAFRMAAVFFGGLLIGAGGVHLLQPRVDAVYVQRPFQIPLAFDMSIHDCYFKGDTVQPINDEVACTFSIYKRRIAGADYQIGESIE